jgi:hypothetical protein
VKGTPSWVKDRGSYFYRTAALLAIAVAIAGFFLTYLLPMAQARFAGPGPSHLHGAILASWLILVALQSFLLPSHRKLGWLAMLLGPAVVVSTVAVGIAANRRDLAQGIMTGMAGTVTAPVLFCALVGAAIWQRRNPQWHKRLILIATTVMLWPAWFRWRHFLPWVPRPDITLGLIVANLPIAIAMVRDRMRFGAIHPAYLWVGLPVIAEMTFEAFTFGTPFWNAFGTWLYAVLT